ncbi:hypothetical protein NE686_17855 [Tissierella carlieri]|uniref:Uncharacterized protein n=1 Tax=Tissierella carlieri TaxID=689904 RepID=A0ABT1SES8_9FIRM|nr:hypothetical protein [Tissierella carlieri]MCQ4924970.1 hypothetical protein [Tissierella carlieri]
MILLHEGIRKDNGQLIQGYVTKNYNGEYLICCPYNEVKYPVVKESIYPCFEGNPMVTYTESDHQVLLKVIEQMKADRNNIFEIKGKNIKYKNLNPVFCHRTSDLHFELTKRLALEENCNAEHLLFECFGYCTRERFHYIHLDDLCSLINYHMKNGRWGVYLY